MPQSLDLGADLKDRKRPRERSRDSRKTSGKAANSKSGLANETVAVNEATMRRSIRMPAYLSKSKSEIAEAFLDLEWKQRYRLAGAMQDPNSPFKLNRSSSVTQRNRYGNIQPWDNSRVQLKTPIGGSDYVNASPIKLQSLSRRTTRKIRRTSSTTSASSITIDYEYNYIATQGPKEGQFSHFWHMVSEQSVGGTGVVIMLTPCYEGNKEKCAQYFPLDKAHPIVLPAEKRTAESPHHQVVAPTQDDENNTPKQASLDTPPVEMTEEGEVSLVSSSYDTEIGCIVRTLRLRIGNDEKTIIHYLYEHWPDFGKPEAEERAALLRLMKKSKEDAGSSPRVVHCSAGVGRTGTFVALDFLTAELEAGRLAKRPDENAEDTNTNSGDSEPQEQVANKSQDTSTYGKSGISRSKVTTPELKQGEGSTITGDLIHDTVDSLRQQRMMMVMNEVQYSLLYEVVKEAFLDMYAEKATGAVVMPLADEAGNGGDRSAKAARRTGESIDAGDKMELSSSSPPQSQSSNAGSEADTEIAGMTPRADDSQISDEIESKEEVDPYAEVAPERIKANLGMKGQ